MKILVTPTSLQPGKNPKMLKKLEEFATELVFNPMGRPLTEDELIPLLKGCDGYVAGLDFITDKVICASQDLKIISRYGAGYDRVDIKSAKEHGIIVTNTPGVNAQAVGELAFALVLSIARKIPYLDQKTREGEWVRSTGMELADKTIGIMGLGAIGKVVAKCAQGFSMKVITYDPYINESYCKEHHIQVATFDEVIEQADVMSLHLPLNNETYHLIGKEAIDRMKKGAILVNASRGGIIDEEAAYEALKSGKLAGVGLDAFEQEPPTDSKLFEFSNVIFTPHTGAHTKEATDHMADTAIDNLIEVLNHRECRFDLTK